MSDIATVLGGNDAQLRSQIGGGSNPPYKRWRAARANVKAGIDHADVLFVGDSTTLGYGSASGSPGDQRKNSVPAIFARMLNYNGNIIGQSQNFIGNGSFSPANEVSDQYDARIVKGNAWSQGVPGLGGAMLTATTSTNALSFTPVGSVDTFDIYYLRNGSLGSFAMDIDGGSATVVSTGGGVAIRKATITGSLAAHTLNLKWSAGNAVFIIGVNAYDSSKKWVHCFNAGWVGADTGDLISGDANYGALKSIELFAADLTVISVGINDWNLGTALATYESRVQSLVNSALVNGDCVLMSGAPSLTDVASALTQQLYIDAMARVAKASNILFVDNFSRLQSYAISQPLGFYADTRHPNYVGYVDLAENLYNVIGRI